MDKFTENLAEELKRFALAGVGAISLTIDKSREIIDQLVARGEATASEGQAACGELQKKMAEQLEAFSQKLRADYENASFDQLLARCDRLSPDQKQRLIERLTAEPGPNEDDTETPAADPGCDSDEGDCEGNETSDRPVENCACTHDAAGEEPDSAEESDPRPEESGE